MKVFPSLGVLFQVFELLCYIFIYSFLHRHDLYMIESSVISTEVFKKRQNRNSLTLGGQVKYLLMFTSVTCCEMLRHTRDNFETWIKKISPPFSLFRANTKCVRDLLNLNLASWVCFRLEPICTNKEPAQENLSLTNIIGFLLHQC